MKLKQIALITMIGASCIASCQQIPTEYSGNLFITRTDTYVTAGTNVKNLLTNGKLTVDVNSFIGENITKSRAVIGCGIAGSYEFTRNGLFTLGFGVPIPLSQFTWDQVRTDSVGLEIGFSYRFDFSQALKVKPVKHVLK